MGNSFLPDLEIRQEVDAVSSASLVFSTAVSTVQSIFFGSSLLGLVQFVIGGVVQLGYAKILLKQYEGQEVAFGELFSEMNRFTVGFLQSFLRTLYTFLWTLLLIIPGIVAALSYSMTPFLLAEHPEMTAQQAIKKSKEMMNGHKWELFCLNLSFIGWVILCALTMNLGFLALNPYMNAAYAVFYRNLTQPQAEVIG